MMGKQYAFSCKNCVEIGAVELGSVLTSSGFLCKWI